MVSTFLLLVSFSAIYSEISSLESYDQRKRGTRKTSGRSAGEWWKEWWGKYILEVKDPTIELVVCCGPQVSYPPPVRPPQLRDEFPQPPISNVNHGVVATQHVLHSIPSSLNESPPELHKPSSFVTNRTPIAQSFQPYAEKSIEQKSGTLSHTLRQQRTNLRNPSSTQVRTHENNIHIQQEPNIAFQPNPKPNSHHTELNLDNSFPKVPTHQQHPSSNQFSQSNQKSILSPNFSGNGRHNDGYQSFGVDPVSKVSDRGEHGVWRPNQPPVRPSSEKHVAPHRNNQQENIPRPNNQISFPPSHFPARKTSDQQQRTNFYPEERSNSASNNFPAGKSHNQANYRESEQFLRESHNPSNTEVFHQTKSSFERSINSNKPPPNSLSLHSTTQHNAQTQKFSTTSQARLNKHPHSRFNGVSNLNQHYVGKPTGEQNLGQSQLPIESPPRSNNPVRFHQWISTTQKPAYEGNIPVSNPHALQIRKDNSKSFVRQPPVQSQSFPPTAFPSHSRKEKCVHAGNRYEHQHAMQDRRRQHGNQKQNHLHPLGSPNSGPDPRLVENIPRDNEELKLRKDQHPKEESSYVNHPTMSPASAAEIRYPEKSVYHNPSIISTQRPHPLDLLNRFPQSGIPPVPQLPPLPIERPPYPGTSRVSHNNHFPNIAATPTKSYKVIGIIHPNESLHPQTQSPLPDYNIHTSSTLNPNTDISVVTYPPPVKPPTYFSSQKPAIVQPIDGSSTAEDSFSVTPSVPSRKDGDADCPNEDTPRVVARPDNPLSDGSMPPCAVEGKGFCLLTNDYPNDFVNEAVDNSINKVRLMYEELQTVGDPKLFERHDGNSSAAKGDFVCQTAVEFERPGWVRDAVSQDWMLVINTDVFPQKIRTESCKNPNQQCSYIAPYYHSSCQQRFSLHRLLALDPNDRNKSPVVTLFKFPAGCSCRVDPIRKDNYVKDYN